MPYKAFHVNLHLNERFQNVFQKGVSYVFWPYTILIQETVAPFRAGNMHPLSLFIPTVPAQVYLLNEISAELNSGCFLNCHCPLEKQLNSTNKLPIL